jgi:hypothetical protein
VGRLLTPGALLVALALPLAARATAVDTVRLSHPFSQQQVLLSPDPEPLALYGVAMDMDADTLVIGAPFSESFGENRPGPGAAFVYQRRNGEWLLDQQLRPSDAELVPDRHVEAFGLSVSIDGHRIAVAAPLHWHAGQAYTGALYVFTRGPNGVWFEEQELTPGPQDGAYRYGYAALDGGTLLIAAGPRHQHQTEAALLFYRRVDARWAEEQRIVLPATKWLDVELNGDTALAAVEALDGTSAARVYHRVSTRWEFAQQLRLSDDPRVQASVGAHPAAVIDGEHMLVQVDVRSRSEPQRDLGTVVLPFSRQQGTWVRGNPLLKTSRMAFMALHGRTAVVGLPFDWDNQRALVFERSVDGWVQRTALRPRWPQATGVFGADVTTYGDTVVVGDASAPVGQPPTYIGAAYVFERVAPASTCVCGEALAAPPEDVDDALVRPNHYAGWQRPQFPSRPPGPGNPLRVCLSIGNANSPYHRVWNALVWRTGCR